MTAWTGFLSDNTAPACPEILAALVEASSGPMPSYGEDPLTARLKDRLTELFEAEVEVFPVTTGTAANVLSLAALAPPYGAILCHELSHLIADESTAPELFTGGARLVPLPGVRAKLAAATVAARLAAWPIGDVHAAQPAVLAVTQATELGAVYTVEELGALGELCRRHGLAFFMDGARFANAVAELGCRPAELTSRVGVKILSLGTTKNGTLNAEAIVSFDPAVSRILAWQVKRGGQLTSKMRYLSAQLLAYLADDLWLRNARHANRMAQRLAAGLAGLPSVEAVTPVQGNEVFVRLPEACRRALRAEGYAFYDNPAAGPDACRLVTAWNTEAAAVDGFLDATARVVEPQRRR